MKKVQIQLQPSAPVQEAMKFTTLKAAQNYISKKEGREMLIYFSHAYYTSL